MSEVVSTMMGVMGVMEPYQEAVGIGIYENEYKRPFGLLLHQGLLLCLRFIYLALHRPRRLCEFCL